MVIKSVHDRQFGRSRIAEDVGNTFLCQQRQEKVAAVRIWIIDFDFSDRVFQTMVCVRLE